MEYTRPTFEETVHEFKSFLSSQEWSQEIRWINSNEVACYKNKLIILRPENMDGYDLNKNVYDKGISTKKSIRIDGYFQIKNVTYAIVDIWGGEAAFLNYGVLNSKFKIIRIKNKFIFNLLKKIFKTSTLAITNA